MLDKMMNTFRGVDYTELPTPNYLSISHAIDSVVSQSESKIRDGYYPVHVSSAIRFCPRKQFLMQQTKKEYKRSVSVADEYLWAIGKALEAVNRNKVIQAYGSHNIVGRWSCKCEHTYIHGLGRDVFKLICSHCRTSVLSVYNEFTLNHDGILAGNPDLLLYNDASRKLHVVEFKSINPADFKELKYPNADYIMQAYSYLRLMDLNREMFKEMGIEVDTESFTIHYSSKGYLFKGSVQKEFRIYVKDLPQSYIDQFDKALIDIKRSKTQLELPERLVCKTPKDSLAVKCPVREECFGCQN